MPATKLIKRLRDHDWLAALIEFVIVVAGILLALQVSNWNQERQDRDRGARYAQRLRAELTSDTAAIDEAVRVWQQVSAYGESAMAYSERGSLVNNDGWKTVLAYYQAG